VWPACRYQIKQPKNRGRLMAARSMREEHVDGFWVLEAADLDEAGVGAQGRRRCRAPVEVRQVTDGGFSQSIWAIVATRL